MKRPLQRKPFFRLLSALSIAALGLPTLPAFALRTSLEGTAQTGLEEALSPTFPAGLEENGEEKFPEPKLTVERSRTLQELPKRLELPVHVFPDQVELSSRPSSPSEPYRIFAAVNNLKIPGEQWLLFRSAVEQVDPKLKPLLKDILAGGMYLYDERVPSEIRNVLRRGLADSLQLRAQSGFWLTGTPYEQTLEMLPIHIRFDQEDESPRLSVEFEGQIPLQPEYAGVYPFWVTLSQADQRFYLPQVGWVNLILPQAERAVQPVKISVPASEAVDLSRYTGKEYWVTMPDGQRTLLTPMPDSGVLFSWEQLRHARARPKQALYVTADSNAVQTALVISLGPFQGRRALVYIEETGQERGRLLLDTAVQESAQFGNLQMERTEQGVRVSALNGVKAFVTAASSVEWKDPTSVSVMTRLFFSQLQQGAVNKVIRFTPEGHGLLTWEHLDTLPAASEIAEEVHAAGQRIQYIGSAIYLEPLSAAGLEETDFPLPREVDSNSPPAEGIWEGGFDVLPSDRERLARMAFEAPRGGPPQYLRLFASLNVTLPATLREERYEGQTLLNYLPDGTTLNSGYINAIGEPFVRSRIRQLLTEQGPLVRARVHLDDVDVEIPMRPINVWADGMVRYEGRVPAEDTRFHVDRSFTVEVYWDGQWRRLRQEGRIRIEPPNPSQIAALSGPDDLGMGQHDAQGELRYARGQLTEPGDDEEIKKVNAALLEAGIVTNQNLPPGERAPYLSKLQARGQISPAGARRAFVAQQRAALVQKDGFFEGMQFKLVVLPSGGRLLMMYNPNRANTPKPMPGAAHPLSEDKPVQFKEPTGEVVTLRQRMLPVPTDRLHNPLKVKVNPYGYVWGHVTLPVTEQVAQSSWTEAIDAVVEQTWQQKDRLTVIGVNLGAKAAASLPDWAHAHDIPWRMPVDEAGDSEILWKSEEQGIRLGLLRDPFLTTFVFEGDEESGSTMITQAKNLVARLRAEGLGDYNAWGVVRPDGIGRLFVLPRNPVEPDPPADAAEKKWKPMDDYAKPIADQEYWSVELSPGQRRLMSRSEMERAGISASGPPLVLKGRPLLEIKMGLMELRRFLLISQLVLYEDPNLEARLIKSYELVGVPWSDPRILQILDSLPPATPGLLGEDSSRQVLEWIAEMEGIGSADQLVLFFDAISEWRHRHVDAFNRLPGDPKSSFTATAERQIEQWAAARPDLVRKIPDPQGPVPTPDSEIPPVLAVALNPTFDRGVRVIESDASQKFLEVSESAGGPGANLTQASSALGREAYLMGLFPGAVGERAVEALHDHGVSVHQIQGLQPQPGTDTRASLLVESSRPGRRERRLVGEGAVTPPGLIQQVRTLLESEQWKDRRYSLVMGERWVGLSAMEVAGEAADLARFAKGQGNEVHVTANLSWTPDIWETVLASSPDTVSSSLEAFAKFLNRTEQIDLWRHRPEEVAQAVDAARRRFGVREWLLHLGVAGTVLVTDRGWWHVIPSPVLRLTYLSGSTDVVDAAYLRYRAKQQVPVNALAAGITAALLFMEKNGIVPSDEEVRSHLFRAQVNVLPRPVPALGGLEERTARALDLLAEVRTGGRGIVVVPEGAFSHFSGLEEFLGQLSVQEGLSKSIVVWGSEAAVERVAKKNPSLRIFRDPDPAAVSAYLAGLEEAESVHVLGAPAAAMQIERYLSPWGIPVRVIGWNLVELLDSIGVETDALTQVGLEELQSVLFQIRGT